MNNLADKATRVFSAGGITLDEPTRDMREAYPDIWVSPLGQFWLYKENQYHLMDVYSWHGTAYVFNGTYFCECPVLIQSGFGILPEPGYQVVANDGNPFNLDLNNWRPVLINSPYYRRLQAQASQATVGA